jgi:hypothetical protein
MHEDADMLNTKRFDFREFILNNVIFVILLLLIIVIASISLKFLSLRVLRGILMQSSVRIIMALVRKLGTSSIFFIPYVTIIAFVILMSAKQGRVKQQTKENTYRDIKDLIRQLTLEEKAELCGGEDFWHLRAVDRLGIPQIMVSDAGLRKQKSRSSRA